MFTVALQLVLEGFTPTLNIGSYMFSVRQAFPSLVQLRLPHLTFRTDLSSTSSGKPPGSSGSCPELP